MAAETGKTAAAGEADIIGSYLKRPYARVVIPETDGTFRGELLEFPGCLATGDTAAEALANLEAAAESWLEVALSQGQQIPEPTENTEFSGRLVLRMPKSLHKKAAVIADRDGVSLNQFIVTSIAAYVGEHAHPQAQSGFVQATNLMATQGANVVTMNFNVQQNTVVLSTSDDPHYPTAWGGVYFGQSVLPSSSKQLYRKSG